MEQRNLTRPWVAPKKFCHVTTPILPWGGRGQCPVLTEIVYRGSCVHVLIMLHVDHDVKVSLHVVSVAVALWPHDICKGSGETKNRAPLTHSTAVWAPCPSLPRLDKRESRSFQGVALPGRDRAEESTEAGKWLWAEPTWSCRMLHTAHWQGHLP